MLACSASREAPPHRAQALVEIEEARGADPPPPAASTPSLLDMMPGPCPSGRIYVDLRQLLGDEDVRSLVRELATRLLGADRSATGERKARGARQRHDLARISDLTGTLDTTARHKAWISS